MGLGDHNTIIMEATLLACIFGALTMAVTGAPTYMESEETQFARQYPEDHFYIRDARSQFVPQYIMPCGASAATNPMQVSTFTAPHHHHVPRYAPVQYGNGVPHYRSVDEQLAEPEMLAFSDMDQMQRHGTLMDHVPMARTTYGLSAPDLELKGHALTSASGPAYGVFPKAHVGGCNVPLLFSCSPSISSGHIMEHQGNAPESPAESGNTYRLVDEPSLSHDHPDETPPQHLNSVHENRHVLLAHA